jgi:hypothetical protein
MADVECPFSRLLFIFQNDPDLLEEEEWVALEEHLFGDSPCRLCYEEMPENLRFIEEARKHARRSLTTQE